jgi:hypothetical protein
MVERGTPELRPERLRGKEPSTRTTRVTKEEREGRDERGTRNGPGLVWLRNEDCECLNGPTKRPVSAEPPRFPHFTTTTEHSIQLPLRFPYPPSRSHPSPSTSTSTSTSASQPPPQSEPVESNETNSNPNPSQAKPSQPEGFDSIIPANNDFGSQPASKLQAPSSSFKLLPLPLLSLSSSPSLEPEIQFRTQNPEPEPEPARCESRQDLELKIPPFFSLDALSSFQGTHTPNSSILSCTLLLLLDCIVHTHIHTYTHTHTHTDTHTHNRERELPSTLSTSDPHTKNLTNRRADSTVQGPSGGL